MVAQEILAQKLVVEFEERGRVIVGQGDILGVEPAKGPNGAHPARNGVHGHKSGPHRTDLDDDEESSDDDHWADSLP